ncbi:MAG: DUF655 domain-containing protein [Halobacteriaceae archaeon]
MNDSNGSEVKGIVLDFLPRGRSEDERPQYERSPVAYAVSPDDFTLYELALVDNPEISIGDRIILLPTENQHSDINDMRTVQYEDLSGGAQSELEYAIEEIVEENEDEYVDFYNNAQPITLRLHQLNLLPGIGKKLRNDILDARKREPFESFEEVEERISGLHDPKQTLVDRILEEIRDEDLKYRNFVGE